MYDKEFITKLFLSEDALTVNQLRKFIEYIIQEMDRKQLKYIYYEYTPLKTRIHIHISFLGWMKEIDDKFYKKRRYIEERLYVLDDKLINEYKSTILEFLNFTENIRVHYESPVDFSANKKSDYIDLARKLYKLYLNIDRIEQEIEGYRDVLIKKFKEIDKKLSKYRSIIYKKFKERKSEEEKYIESGLYCKVSDKKLKLYFKKISGIDSPTAILYKSCKFFIAAKLVISLNKYNNKYITLYDVIALYLVKNDNASLIKLYEIPVSFKEAKEYIETYIQEGGGDGQ